MKRLISYVNAANWHKRNTRLSPTVWKGDLLSVCKSLKFDHTIKWYMHKSEFVRENGTHEFLLDFKMQTNN